MSFWAEGKLGSTSKISAGSDLQFSSYTQIGLLKEVHGGDWGEIRSSAFLCGGKCELDSGLNMCTNYFLNS